MTEQNPAMPDARDARPRLALRVGVTGHRCLRHADMPKLRQVVGDLMDDLAAILAGFAWRPGAADLYADKPPLLRLVSPLAEGTDRLVAQAAADRGWKLAVPLPFPREVYEDDFPTTRGDFATLIDRAGPEVVELDGTRGDENAAYLEVGRFVLRNSDLLIAVWDGKPAAGVGGTGQIVPEAQRARIPVLHVDDRPPHAVHILSGDAAPQPYSRHQVADLLAPLLLPTWRRKKHERNHLRAAIAHLQHERVRASAVAPDFRSAGPFAAPRNPLSAVFPGLRDLVGGRHAPDMKVDEKLKAPREDDPAARALYLQFQRADALASHYANLHRSAFVLIYLFGSLSLFAAFTAQFLNGIHAGRFALSPFATITEGAALLLVIALVVSDQMRRWRERWLDYRCLAEMLRQADLLTQIGGACLPDHADPWDERLPTRGWTPWLAAAITRAAGLAGARYDAGYLQHLRDYAARVRLAGQIAYHETTVARSAALGRRLRLFSRLTFVLTLLAIAAEFVWPRCWPLPGGLPWPAWFAGILPALAAASFGIRNQAEFEIVVHRSERLRERLEQETQRLERLDGGALRSTTLRQALTRCTEMMVRDTTEWAAIFEVKESDV